MKICNNCGKELNDNMKFCTGCGTSCTIGTGTANEINSVNLQPQVQMPQQQATTFTIDMSQLSKILPNKKGAELSKNPVLNLIKQNGSGLMYFIYIILYGIALLAALIGALSAKLPGMDLIDKYGSFIGFSSNDLMDLIPFLDTLNGGFQFIKFLAAVPIILIFAGSLIFYIKCKNNDDTQLPMNGLLLTKIPVIINVVINALIVFAVLIIGVIGSIALDSGWAFVAALFISLYFAVKIIYNVIILRVISSVKETFLSGYDHIANSRLSVLIVLNYISAGFTLFFGGNGVFGNIISSCAIIFITICLMTYKKNSEILRISTASTESIASELQQ